MGSIFEASPDIKAASSSILGIVALIILVLGGLAYYFFKDSPDKVKPGDTLPTFYVAEYYTSSPLGVLY